MEKIKDFYCNGYFGRNYGLRDAVIIDESSYSITIKTIEDEILTATFDDVETKDEMKIKWCAGF